jgi:hypothetical protein
MVAPAKALQRFQELNPGVKVITVTPAGRILVKPGAGGMLVLGPEHKTSPWFAGTVVVDTLIPKRSRWFNFRVWLYQNVMSRKI